ncbi:MAG: hypothetical protein ABI295_11090 [Xanthomarina sp.]
MKTSKLKTALISTLAIFTLLTSSCSEDNSGDPIIPEQEITQLVQAAEMDRISASLEELIIEIYEAQQGPALTTCASITLVENQNLKELTVTFQPDGCIIRDYAYSGELIITYEQVPQATEILLNYVLNNFSIDNIELIGNNSILKELTNENEKPQFTHAVDLTVIWPNGTQVSKVGQVIREWTTKNNVFTNNVFDITGSWMTTFPTGSPHSYEAITPVKRIMTCNYFVSGLVNVSHNLYGGVLDYGAGSCDNIARFTFGNGNEINMILD